jgi:DNA-binding NarL/FixJ family response regulator
LLERLASVPGNVLARAAHDTLLANERIGAARAATLRASAERWKQLQRPLLEHLTLSLAGEATTSHRRVRAGGDLTPRELEIARLVAEGLSNRVISERLGISERTVEHHVGSILSQLGIRSRWLVTPQLLESTL